MADGLTLFLGATTVGATVAWINARVRAYWWQSMYSEAVQTMEHYALEEPASEYALCGSCGKSVPLEPNGFTLAEHSCHPDLFSSTGVAQREI